MAKTLPRPKTVQGRVFRIAALVVTGGRVVAVGHNHLKTSPLVHTLCQRYGTGRDCFRRRTHAEMEALKRSNGHARGAVMYIARVTAVGMPVSAAPCGLCRAMLVAEGVRRVVYTENATTAGSLTFA